MSERVPTNRPQVSAPETDPRTANTPVPWATVQAIARTLRAAVHRIATTGHNEPVPGWTRSEAARVACSLLDALISCSPGNAADLAPWRAELRKVAVLEQQIRWLWFTSLAAVAVAIWTLVEVVSLAARLTPH